ncbi:acetyltransferase [Nocardioides perillae]|uniref:PglD N-terminal domain-containing protein n=1 Tax=Nocardioides perillae TaxID=1119534 RepID=A0A7Y9RTP7_9ACTN|nr:acetyltransferase [Nocardioides perillae]NYG54693.1 hypothetical protein [Nocardioides perillae]
MVEPLVIVGAGGFGRETADVVEAINAIAPTWELLGFVDDAPSDVNLERLAARGYDLLGGTDHLVSLDNCAHYVIGVGCPRARRAVADRLRCGRHVPATLVHPAATIGSAVSIGEGTVICAGARLTTNIAVGRHVHVNPSATVGHDTTLGDFVSLNPASSISGDCVIGAGSLVGVGAVVLNQLRVGEDATVGASACVVRDVLDGATVKGVPAR